MRLKTHFFILSAAFLISCTHSENRTIYPDRWVFVHDRAFTDDSQVEEVREIVRTAAEHGLNGMVLSAGLDRLDLKPPDYFRRLEEVRNFCTQYGVEIVPLLFSVGYGYSVILHDKNLCEGLPVKDALFVVSGKEARLVPDPTVGIVNGSFENIESAGIPGFEYSGRPGEVLFADRTVFKDGKVSLRFENLGAYPEKSNRVSQEVSVRPYRLYRLSCWVRTEALEPSGSFSLEVYGGDRRINFFDPQMPPTNEWQKLVLGFNTWGYDKVVISAGAAGAKKGKFWVDGLSLEEVGLANILRRPGTPLVVRSEKDGTVYEEGQDYTSVADPEMDFRFEHDGPPIQLLAGSRIKNGERLRVSWYHGFMAVQRKGQITVCMSEPELYEIWRTQARLIHKYLAPKKYFLDMDEIRAGGTCQACRDRHMTMGQILGDCITRQAGLLREVNPEAEVFIWSDMLEPCHNAGDTWGKYFYLVDGLFTGSWNYVPKDIVMVSWWNEIMAQSLAHLSSQGFRILASSSGDLDLQVTRDWLKALDKTLRVVGIMYTTWQKNYNLLAAFGDLVSHPRK